MLNTRYLIKANSKVILDCDDEKEAIEYALVMATKGTHFLITRETILYDSRSLPLDRLKALVDIQTTAR